VTIEPEVALIRQRFLIDGILVGDLARARVVIASGLEVEL
jgi:hypothetical protein